MGWAKYHEDVVSRLTGDRFMRGTDPALPRHAAPPRQTPAKTDRKQVNKMSSLKQFAVTAPRPLPVIVLADVSGSMGEDGKIDALNAALRDMVSALATESRIRAEIQVGLITFGGTAKTHLPLAPAHTIRDFPAMPASGGTPMGAAFDLARRLLEDKEAIPSRAYRPVLILLSDGLPTDDWEPAFDALTGSERAMKATRLAMAIGGDADEEMLARFANDVEAPLFRGHNARDIHRFFRAVTMSVTERSASQNPDQSGPFLVPPPSDEDDLDLDFK